MDKCWARCLAGCDGKISGEHIISASLWEGDHIFVQGLQWCRSSHKEIPVRRFASNILCERHNSELSNIGVDGGGAAAFDVFRQAGKVQAQRSENIKAGFQTGRFDVCEYDINGPLLERWLLKTLINMELSGDQGLTLGPYLAQTERPNCELVEIVYGRRPFPGRSGLYFVADSAQSIQFQERLRYVAYLKTVEEKSYVAAAGFSFHGFPFILSLEPQGLPSTVDECDNEGRVVRKLSLLYHPEVLNVNLNDFPSLSIRVTWKGCESFPPAQDTSP